MKEVMFWILFVSNGSGHGTHQYLEKFDTREECEAVQQSLIDYSKDWWRDRITYDNSTCRLIVAKVRE